MSIDIIIVGILLALAILGYMRGFIQGIINLVVICAYFYFASDLLNVGLKTLNDTQLTKDVASSQIMQYLIIMLGAIILLLVVNLITRKIIRKSFVSKFDKIGGVLIFLALGYFLICVGNVVVLKLVPFIDFPHNVDTSYFLSSSFKQYNFIYWWWLDA